MSTCSDKSTLSYTTEGDYQDGSFVQVRGLITEFTDSLLVEMNVAFGHLNMDRYGPPVLLADSVSVTYDPETCWWELYVDADAGDTSFVYVDSLRFMDDSGCQQYPVSTITQYDYRTFADLLISNGQETSHVRGSGQFAMSGFQSDYIVVDYDAVLQTSMSFDFEGLDVDYEAADGDLEYVQDSLYSSGADFPVSGRIPVTMELKSFSRDSSLTRYWSFIITFNEEYYSVYAESGGYYWGWEVYYARPE